MRALPATDSGIVPHLMRKNILFTAVALLLILATACRPKAAITPPPPPPTTQPTQPTPTLLVADDAVVVEPLPVAEQPVGAEVGEPQQQLEVVGAAVSNGFTGRFDGVLMGDNNSSAPARLELVQDGSTVSGTLSLGEGLFVDGGNCGAMPVPAGAVGATGQIDPGNADHLDAAAVFFVQGISITVDLDAELGNAGDSLGASAVIDLPLLCGRDPGISGSFGRSQ